MIREAMLYEAMEGQKVHCYLCAHHCRIMPARYGFCNVRENIEGRLYTYAYGRIVAANVDPIEKKPLFHMLPGSRSFSIATIGCNFRCGFCQNWQISQAQEAERQGVKADMMRPEEIVAQARAYGCDSIAYTYTEPTIFFEYAYETAKLAKQEGLYNVFVTNGYMTKEALDAIHPYLDAANVDLKYFSDRMYRTVCKAKLEPVLETIRRMHDLDTWVEVTTLVIPGENDAPEELKGMARFLAGVGEEIPWHLSAFHSEYKYLDREATSLDILRRAYSIGKEAGLRYVYLGNVPEEENTHCYNCNELLIKRFFFEVLENRLHKNRCPRCNTILDGRIVMGYPHVISSHRGSRR